jgi:trk system potassium uptake protein TrkA
MAQRQDLRIVIAGGGRMGMRTAELLDNRGHDIVIVERDAAVVERLSDAYIASVIKGDATRPSVLRQADLGRCDAVAALTGDAGTNLAVCLIAQRIAAEHDATPRTIARTNAPREEEEYAGFVDELVFPEGVGAQAAASVIAGAGVRSLQETTGDLEILEVEVGENAPAAERTLEEVHFPSGSLVISDYGGHRIARAGTTLHAGEHYIIAAEADVLEEVMNLLQG